MQTFTTVSPRSSTWANTVVSAGQLRGQIDGLAQLDHPAGSHAARWHRRVPTTTPPTRVRRPGVERGRRPASGAASDAAEVAPGADGGRPDAATATTPAAARSGRGPRPLASTSTHRLRPARHRGHRHRARSPSGERSPSTTTTSTRASATQGRASSLGGRRPSSTSTRCWPAWMPADGDDRCGGHVGRPDDDDVVRRRAAGCGSRHQARATTPTTAADGDRGAGADGPAAPGRPGRAGPGCAGSTGRPGRDRRSGRSVVQGLAHEPSMRGRGFRRSPPGGSRARGGPRVASTHPALHLDHQRAARRRRGRPSSAWMKLACLVDTSAVPTRRPLAPACVDQPAGRVPRRVGEDRAGVRARRAGARGASATISAISASDRARSPGRAGASSAAHDDLVEGRWPSAGRTGRGRSAGTHPSSPVAEVDHADPARGSRPCPSRARRRSCAPRRRPSRAPRPPTRSRSARRPRCAGRRTGRRGRAPATTRRARRSRRRRTPRPAPRPGRRSRRRRRAGSSPCRRRAPRHPVARTAAASAASAASSSTSHAAARPRPPTR